MTATAAPPPIPGERIDPPPKPTERMLRKVEDRSEAAGAGFRAFTRFGASRASLLAAGTTYYIFLAMFALITLAFGLTALIGSDELSQLVNDALVTAFPNLTGKNGSLDPENLRSIGQATSIIGLVVLLYSSSGAMVATSDSVHLIYGAPKDGRNFVVARLRLLGWMLVIAPLILLSFAASLLVATFTQPVLDFVGSTSTAGQVLLRVGTSAVSLAIAFLVVYLILGHLGGIRPRRLPRVVGASLAAVGIEVLKAVMSSIVAWSISKPQYGAFAAPITVLLVLYLLTVVTYGAASLTAGFAEKANAPVTDAGPSTESDGADRATATSDDAA